MQLEKLESARYPNLQTVLMVDDFIKEHSMVFTRTEIFNKIPKKMRWGTFRIIMDYLEETLRINTDDDGIVSYIWNPELFDKIKDMQDISV